MATSTDPRLGAIRLAWWRERLDALDTGAPAEPRLRAVASEIIPRGVSGRELSQLEDAWLPLLQPFPWDEAQADGLRLRGRLLFGIGARLLGGNAEEAEPAGELWSLVDGAAHCSDAGSRTFLLEESHRALARLPNASPREVRRVTVLGAIGARDLLTGRRSNAVRALRRFAAALQHGVRGTYPRS